MAREAERLAQKLNKIVSDNRRLKSQASQKMIRDGTYQFGTVNFGGTLIRSDVTVDMDIGDGDKVKFVFDDRGKAIVIGQ